MKLLSGLKALI